MARGAGKGDTSMSEKRSIARRSGADRRVAERRRTSPRRFAGPGPPPGSRERRKALRRLDYRRSVTNRRTLHKT